MKPSLPRFAGRAALAFWLSAPAAAAQGNHHSAPMGGRSALMGGTGVALGVDGAAPFLNPATITRISAGRLAFSSRFYRYSKESFRDFHQPGPADAAEFGQVELSDTSESHSRVHSVPDSVCYFFPSIPAISWRQRLSLCLSTTEEQELSLKALGYRESSPGVRIDQNQHFEVDWSRFNLGPTWGIVANDDLALGVSLLVTYSRYEHAIVSSSIVENTETGSASTSTYESLSSAYSWDFVPRFGATYQVTRNFSLGASLTLPLAHLFGGVREAFTNQSDFARTQWSGDGEFHAKPPLQLGLGLGAEWESLRFEVDAFLTPGTSEYARGVIDREEVAVEGGQVTSRTAFTIRINERSKTVVNVAAGAEVFVGRRFSLLAGAQTDINALRKLEPEEADARLFRTRMNYYRAGVGICSYTDFGDLMIGLRFDHGRGEVLPVNALVVPPALGRSQLREVGVMLVLAGSLNWGSLKQFAGEITNVVRGQGGPPPDEPPKPLQQPKRE